MACGGPNQAPCGGPVPRVGVSPTPAATCPSVSWTAGPWRYVQSASGCLTREAAGAPIPDGQYQHPVITMRDGHIVAIEEGAAQLLLPPALCGGAPSTPGAPGTIVLDAGACNLMAMVAGKYTARVYVEAAPSSPRSVTGCGTAADPLRFDVTLPAAAGGATFTGCGIAITNGRVTQFTAPVMNVVVNPNSGLGATWNPANCTITLESLDPTAAATKLPAVICDSASNPTNGLLAGTPSTTYLLRIPNTATTVYTATTNGSGSAVVNNMASGVYEVFVGTRSLGYMAYTRCAYVAPP